MPRTTSRATRSSTRVLLELAAGADIFINDAQFTPEQLATTRKGWGHSSWLEGVKIAEEVGVKNLVLFHHDPDSTDKAVDVILRDARGKFANVWAAAEGMVMTLGEENLDVVIPDGRAKACGATRISARASPGSPIRATPSRKKP